MHPPFAGALPGVLGQPAGLRDCLRSPPRLPPRCQIHLTHQVRTLILVFTITFTFTCLQLSVIENLSLVLVMATMSFNVHPQVYICLQYFSLIPHLRLKFPQRDWKPLSGAGHGHYELPYLQVRPRCC